MQEEVQDGTQSQDPTGGARATGQAPDLWPQDLGLCVPDLSPSRVTDVSRLGSPDTSKGGWFFRGGRVVH